MSESTNETAFSSTCPIRSVLSRIADKWSMLVLYKLHISGKQRFNSICRDMPDISQKMLTKTLRTLEEDGLVKREVYAEVPPRVEYELTPRAESLLIHINNLVNWAKEHITEIVNDREKNKR